jgi:hypothetical protein
VNVARLQTDEIIAAAHHGFDEIQAACRHLAVRAIAIPSLHTEPSLT